MLQCTKRVSSRPARVAASFVGAQRVGLSVYSTSLRSDVVLRRTTAFPATCQRRDFGNEPKPFPGAPDDLASRSIPTREDALKMAVHYCELSNEALSLMAVRNVHGARKERLLREIMRVDNVDWIQANAKHHEINIINDQKTWLLKLPYNFGIFTATVSGILSIPMVFHRDTAIWCNNNFVCIEQPPIEELQTMWQVGGWTWSWMEPALGTASFVLLAMQLVRAQMGKINLKPYTEYIQSRRADRLADIYPQYNRDIVRDFAKSDPWHN